MIYYLLLVHLEAWILKLNLQAPELDVRRNTAALAQRTVPTVRHAATIQVFHVHKRLWEQIVR